MSKRSICETRSPIYQFDPIAHVNLNTSNDHMFFTNFLQSRTDHDPKFDPLAVFGLLNMMDGFYLKNGAYKSIERRSSG